jgi:hypothetical protein
MPSTAHTITATASLATRSSRRYSREVAANSRRQTPKVTLLVQIFANVNSRSRSRDRARNLRAIDRSARSSSLAVSNVSTHA